MTLESNVTQPKKQSNNFLKIILAIGLFGGVICTLSCGFLVMLYYLDSGSAFHYTSPTAVTHFQTSEPYIPEPTSESYNSSPSTSDTNTSWFTGGTLHKAKVSEWRNATYANRLATSADFIAATQDVDYGDMAGFKQMATDLETCISTAVSGGDVDNEDVVFISSMCTVMLFPK
jgi:hypothetical protein